MKIKRFYLFCIVFTCFGIVLTSCSKKDDGSDILGSSSVTTINAKVENGSSYSFDNVKAVMYFDNSGEFVVGESKYSNGEFNIELPETVDKAYLYQIVESEFAGLTISDKTALGNGITIEAYESGSYEGDFYYGSVSQNGLITSVGGYIYVDRDVNITGSTTETDYDSYNFPIPMTISANVTLKRGWNIVYMTKSVSLKLDGSGNATSGSGTISYTSKEQGGLKWYKDDSDNGGGDDNGSGSSSVTSIDAKVVNGNSYSFDNVKAVMYSYSDDYVAGSSKYSSGGFNVALPETIDQTYLLPITDADSEDLSSNWITVSDKTAMGNGISLEGYESGSYQGDFYYGAVSQNTNATTMSVSVTMTEGMYLYVDKDVNMTGSYTETDYIDDISVPINYSASASLKKGWNIVYYTESISIKFNTNGDVTSGSGTASYTSKDPGGLKWYYQDDFNNLMNVSSALRSSRPESVSKLSGDIEKRLSEFKFFQKSK